MLFKAKLPFFQIAMGTAGWLLLTVNPGSADSPARHTLDGLLKSVTATHPLFMREEAHVSSAQAAAEEAAGGEDWVASVQSYSVQDQSPRSQAFYPDSIIRQGATASISKPVWLTGGNISLGYDYYRQDQQIPGVTMQFAPGQPPVDIPGDSSKYYQGVATLSIVQPLWQDRGGKVSRLASDVAAMEAEAVRFSSDERKEEFLLAVTERFISWTFNREAREIAEARLGLVRQDRDRVREMRRSNLVEAVDLILADDAVLAAEQGVAASTAAELASAEELERLTGITGLASGRPDFDLYSVPQIKQGQDETTALEHSRIIAELDRKIAQADRAIDGKDSLAKPRLDVVLTGASEGAGAKTSDGFGNNAFDYTAALRFSYPLGNNAASASYRKSVFDRARLTAAREDAILSIGAAARGLVVQLIEMEKVRQVDRNRIRTADARVNAELDRYRQGRSDFRFVISARDAVWQAKLAFAADSAKCQAMHYRLKSLTDRLYPLAD